MRARANLIKQKLSGNSAGWEKAKDESKSEVEGQPEPTAAKVNSFASLLNTSDWECEVCMLANSAALAKCRSCESPNPNMDGAAGGANENVVNNDDGSIGFGGFTFG